ncbi:MAG: hypothetical protein ABI587_07645 [Gemmatimonadales bacterium]
MRLTKTRLLDIGTILLADLDEGGAALGNALLVARVSPWCPVVVRLGKRPADPTVIEAAMTCPFPPAYLVDTTLSFLDPELLVGTVKGRRWPTPAETASYILRRTGWSGAIATALAHCVELSDAMSKKDVHRSTTWRRLEKAGPLTPRDWMAVGLLVQSSRDAQCSLEEMALAVGWETSTLRARARTLVGPAFEKRRQLVGWEWILEAVLRKSRYVKGEYPMPTEQQNSVKS